MEARRRGGGYTAAPTQYQPDSPERGFHVLQTSDSSLFMTSWRAKFVLAVRVAAIKPPHVPAGVLIDRVG